MSEDDIEQRLLAIFQHEVVEHLDVIADSLLSLEAALPGAPDAELVETTLREVHTLKGAARSVSQTAIESICQSCETILSRVAKGLSLTQATVDAIQTGMDAVVRLASGADITDVDVSALTAAIERS